MQDWILPLPGIVVLAHPWFVYPLLGWGIGLAVHLRHPPFLTRAVLQRVRAYTKRGFHPDDTDNTALLDHWTAELYGEHGTLVDHLR